jgi:hypothetical protein
MEPRTKCQVHGVASRDTAKLLSVDAADRVDGLLVQIVTSIDPGLVEHSRGQGDVEDGGAFDREVDHSAGDLARQHDSIVMLEMMPPILDIDGCLPLQQGQDLGDWTRVIRIAGHRIDGEETGEQGFPALNRVDKGAEYDSRDDPDGA